MIHLLDNTPSTNTYAKDNAASLAHGDIVLTHNQTAGRGQRGNSWEAQPGMNLTFSMMLRPRHIAPQAQWAISQAVALGIASALEHAIAKATAEPQPPVTVKWPNDIYVGDKKICGILIEHSITSPKTIGHTIAGIGINVNQTEFRSDAPNPVSLAQITGTAFDLDEILADVANAINRYFDIVDSTDPPGDPARRLAPIYRKKLWRGEGFHRFSRADGTPLLARIDNVGHDGRLTLTDSDGTPQSFYFKEVQFVL
ncbi:MAG: biotin--[acetyl-CoA-carboxylase] ligase [Muribaculaceae bacterium]|nr:biotin--[acetyl-CoA-carboxylase] ligase [Muribaculaceae bacterium]